MGAGPDGTDPQRTAAAAHATVAAAPRCRPGRAARGRVHRRDALKALSR